MEYGWPLYLGYGRAGRRRERRLLCGGLFVDAAYPMAMERAAASTSLVARHRPSCDVSAVLAAAAGCFAHDGSISAGAAVRHCRGDSPAANFSRSAGLAGLGLLAGGTGWLVFAPAERSDAEERGLLKLFLVIRLCRPPREG